MLPPYSAYLAPSDYLLFLFVANDLTDEKRLQEQTGKIVCLKFSSIGTGVSVGEAYRYYL